MTPEERELVMALVKLPGKPERLAPSEFLRLAGADDGIALGLGLLEAAVSSRDAVDVELALVVCFEFGFSEEHVKALVTLAFGDWHQRHEDVAMALGEIGSSTSVEALVHLAEWVPEYLMFDDSRALARKAIWSLGSIGGDKARRALASLTESTSGIVAEGARAQLREWT